MASMGEILDGKYEILTEIGKGGMSKVYLARDIRLNKQWAVKEVEKNARDRNNKIVVQSAIGEANMLKKLDHPALPRIVDIIDNGKVICVVMDYIEGVPLSRVIKEKGAQPEDAVIDWAKQLCNVLDYLHTREKPIIYRDMKPANIMLQTDHSDKDHPYGRIKLFDFGIAREYKENKTGDTECMGTKEYAAPEQFGEMGQTDARTDIYCLGATLYHLVTGHTFVENFKPIRSWDPQLSVGFDEILTKCTQRERENRYQSCAELMYALDHYKQWGNEYRRSQKKKLGVFAALFACSILSLGLGFGSLGMRTHTNNLDYEQNMTRAKNEALVENKIGYYEKAIDIKPMNIEPYINMIEAYKEDADFSTDEEQQFKSCINSNLVELKKQSDYWKVAYETGKLYWYYYGYGKTDDSDNQITRMKAAVEWFNDVVQYGDKNSDEYKISLIYRDIGIFNRDITLDIEEASDKGKYEPYWENLRSMAEQVSGEDQEIVQLELYRLIMNSIENYSRKFKADGIKQDDMLAVYDTVCEKLEALNTNSDKTDELKEQLIGRKQTVRQSIDSAYRDGE